MRHVVRRAAEARYAAPPEARAAEGYTRWMIADETTPGSAHTEFNVCALEPGGHVATAVQSFEECFYVTEGTPILRTPDGEPADASARVEFTLAACEVDLLATSPDGR